MKVWLSWFWLVLMMALACFAVTGCATTESENVSSRPWNTPRGFDTGIPGFDNQGR